MPLVRGHAPSVFSRLHLCAARGMIAVVDPEDIMPPMRVQGLDVGGMGTQTVCGDEAREVGVVLAHRGHAAFRRIGFTIICGRASL